MGFEWGGAKTAIIAEAAVVRLRTTHHKRNLRYPRKVFIFTNMNTRSQALAVSALLLPSSFLLAGLLLRASAK